MQELAVHRWDAGIIGGAEPAPVPTRTAFDRIAESFEEFVATGRTIGWAPPADGTIPLEVMDMIASWPTTCPTLVRLP